MNRSEILRLISKQLADLFEQESVELTENSTAESFDEWDSINHIRLLIGLERALNIEFGSDEAGALDDVRALIDLIEKKLA